MDNLRWVLAGIGVLIVAGVYIASRYGAKERRQDLKGHTVIPRKEVSQKAASQIKPRMEPIITISDTDRGLDQSNIPPISTMTQTEEQETGPLLSGSTVVDIKHDDEDIRISGNESSAVSTAEHASFLNETLSFEMEHEQEASTDRSEEDTTISSDEATIPSVEHASFLEQTLAFEVEQETYDQLEEAVESVLGPDVEDDIADVEIPSELSEMQDDEELETETEVGLGLYSDKEEPVQQEFSLDIEPLVLVLSVMTASNDDFFVGKDIRQVLEEEKLEFGDMDVFNFYIEDKQHPIFSVASIIEPGIFNLESIDDYETPGLIIFTQLPGTIPGAEAFDILLNKSRTIAEKLGGQVCDDKRNRLTEQATTHYRDKIVAFEHDVMLARKKQQQ